MGFFSDINEKRKDASLSANLFSNIYGDDPNAIEFFSGGKADVLDKFGQQDKRETEKAITAAELAQMTAAERAIFETRRATEEGQGFLEPFGGVGLSGVEQSGFLTDPQAQFDFLQNNPLFQMGLDNANRQTSQLAAARGRLSSGDTLQQLNNNALLTASPLIAGQKQSIGDLLNFGSGIARAQSNTAIGQGSDVSNLIQSQGNIGAAAIQAKNAANQQTNQNNQQLAGTVAGFFSDPRLKTNIKKVGTENGFNIYSWTWNGRAGELGLAGNSRGVMADEIKVIRPKVISMDRGYMKVNYSELGVKHGD
jgi:hypothetical protein